MHSNVVPTKYGGLGSTHTWPLYQGDRPITTTDRKIRGDALSAVEPGILLPCAEPVDYQLLEQHELTSTYTPLPLLEQQLSFFARQLAHEGPVPVELLQELLLEQLGSSAAAAAAAASSNRLDAILVCLPSLSGAAAGKTAAAITSSDVHNEAAAAARAATTPEQVQAGRAARGIDHSAAAAAAVGQQQINTPHDAHLRQPADSLQQQQQPGILIGSTRQQHQQLCAEEISGHATSAVLAVTVSGSARQKLSLTVLQPGAIPDQLVAPAIGKRPYTAHAQPVCGGPAGELPSSGRDVPQASAPAARSSGAADQDVSVQLMASQTAVLELGSPIQQVCLQHLPGAVCAAAWQSAPAAVTTKKSTAAGAGDSRGMLSQDVAADGSPHNSAPLHGGVHAEEHNIHQQCGVQQPSSQPVAFAWARCQHKVYLTLITYSLLEPPQAAASTANRHLLQANTQQQQQQTPQVTPPGKWQLVLVGVASVTEPILASVCQPLLQRFIVGCQDGSVCVVTAPQQLLAQALCRPAQQQQQQQHGLQSGQLGEAGAGGLHPDDQLPRLHLQQCGVLGWYRAAADQGQVVYSDAAAVCPLLLAAGPHPQHLLAAAAGTLMQHHIHPPSTDGMAANTQQNGPSPHQQQSEVCNTQQEQAAAGAGHETLTPGKLLLQLPQPEVFTALATYSGSQLQWQQTAAAATGRTAAARSCTHVSHLLVVATSRRLLLLDLRKAAQEPLLIWEHCIDSNGVASMQPSLLALLPTPLPAVMAANSCSSNCFAGRQRPLADMAHPHARHCHNHAQHPTAATPFRAEATPGGVLSVASPAAAAAGGIAAGSSQGTAELQVFDACLYPSQMFQPGSQSQGHAALPESWVNPTQASQVAGHAMFHQGHHIQGQGYRQQQQQQQWSQAQQSAQQHLGGMLPPANAVGTNRADHHGDITRDCRRAATAGSDHLNELCGTVVWLSGTSWDVFSVNFRLKWAAGLVPPALVPSRCVLGLKTSLDKLRAKNRSPPTTNSTAAAAGCDAGRGADISTGSAGADSVETAAATGGAALTTGPRHVSMQQRSATCSTALGLIAGALHSWNLQLVPAHHTTAVACDVTRSAAVAHLNKRSAGHEYARHHSHPHAAAQTAAAAARPPFGSKAGASGHSSQSHPLGSWQLPSVVRVVTPGPPQLMARPVRQSVRSDLLSQLQQQRASVVAARGDVRAATEAGLMPGAALDIVKSGLAQQTLDLMAAAADTQGLAICAIPWCWSGGTARAILLRSTADGDLCVQLCISQQQVFGASGRQGDAAHTALQQQRQLQDVPASNFASRGIAAAGAAGQASVAGRAVRPHNLVDKQPQQQQVKQHLLRPILQVTPPSALLPNTSLHLSTGCDAFAAAGAPPADRQVTLTAQPQQVPSEVQAQQGDCQQQNLPDPGLPPALQLQQGSQQPLARTFAALQAWLDVELEPLPGATAAATAGSVQLTHERKRNAQQHLDRQYVELTAHTHWVLMLLSDSQRCVQGMSKVVHRSVADTQQQQLPQASWPHVSNAPCSSSTLVCPPFDLLRFSGRQDEQHRQVGATAAAAKAACNGADRPVLEALRTLAGTLTLPELAALSWKQQRQQLQEGSDAVLVGDAAGDGRRGGSGRAKEPSNHPSQQQVETQQQTAPKQAGTKRKPPGSAAGGAHAAAGQLGAVQLQKLLQQQLPDTHLQLAAQRLADSSSRQHSSGSSSGNSMMRLQHLLRQVQQDVVDVVDHPRCSSHTLRSLTLPCLVPGSVSTWTLPHLPAAQQDGGKAGSSTAAATAAVIETEAAVRAGDRDGRGAVGGSQVPWTRLPHGGVGAGGCVEGDDHGVAAGKKVVSATEPRDDTTMAAAAAATGGDGGVAAAAAAGTLAGGGSPPAIRIVAGEYLPYATLVECRQRNTRICDVTPRITPQQQQQQIGSMHSSGAGDCGGQVTCRTPPGLLALAMSQYAQSKWLQLCDAWQQPPGGEQQQQQGTATATASGRPQQQAAAAATGSGVLRGDARFGSSAASVVLTADALGRSQVQDGHGPLERTSLAPPRKRQKHAATVQQQQQQQQTGQLPEAPGQQQQQQQARGLNTAPRQHAVNAGSAPATSSALQAAQGMRGSPRPGSRPHSQQQQHAASTAAGATGSALVAALTGTSTGSKQRAAHPQQQQQGSGQGAHAAGLAGAAAPGSLPASVLDQQQQQQQQGKPSQPAAGGLLAHLTQQHQQQQKKGGSGRGTSSLLMPSSRRR